MAEPPSASATVLCADQVGTRQLVQRLGAGADASVAAVQRVLAAVWRAHGGRVLDVDGDAVAVAFAHAADAVLAAVDAERALAGHPWPEGVGPRVRVGIHTAAPPAATPEPAATARRVAERVAAVAHGGQVLLDGPTRARLADPLPGGVALRDLGAWRLPGVAGPLTRFYWVVW